MTGEPQLLEAAAALKSALASLQRLAADHPDAGARPTFTEQEQRVRAMLDRLEDRLRQGRASAGTTGGTAP
ncbi:MAG: hypothetical protein FWJ62_08890 [Thermaerobacter sp.]|nr:hypothetical protein [Bacillota bacterium]